MEGKNRDAAVTIFIGRFRPRERIDMYRVLYFYDCQQQTATANLEEDSVNFLKEAMSKHCD